VKPFIKTLLSFSVLFLSACQIFPERKEAPADVRDATIDAQINPKEQQDSVLETLPLMNNAVLSLYNQAKTLYENNNFEQAIVKLERAYDIQPNVGQISQLMAEIYLHKGDFEQSFYWSKLATKNGPSKGKSCEKSWRILALAAEKLENVMQQATALEKKENCIVKAGNRY